MSGTTTVTTHCRMCDYYNQQHSARCCCAGCWRQRQKNTAQHTAPPSPLMSSRAEKRSHANTEQTTDSGTTAPCPHASGRHHCRQCVLPSYHYKTYTAQPPHTQGLSSTVSPTTTTRPRLYQCEGCAPTAGAQPKVSSSPAAPATPHARDCGCSLYCECRRDARQKAQRAEKAQRQAMEASLAAARPAFDAHEVPKMGPGACVYMKAPPVHHDRARFLY